MNMKRIRFLSLVLLVLPLMSSAQPQLTFRMNNPEIKTSGSNYNLEFIVEVKADQTGSYYSSGQIVLYFNNSAFSTSSLFQFILVREGISAKYDDILGQDVYDVVNNFSGTNPNVLRYFGLFAKDVYVGEDPDEAFLAEVSDTWQTYARVRIRILDEDAIANLKFWENDMNGEHFFLDAPNTQVSYLSPNTYGQKDLMNLYLGRLYSMNTWTQFGGLDWDAEANTSVWDGSPSLADGDYKAATLRIHDGAVLTIATDAGVTATGNTDIEGAEALVIESSGTGLSSSGYFIDNGTIAYHGSGSIKVERFFDSNFYRFVSPPIATAQYGLLQGTNGVDDFWQWNEVLNQWENLNLEPSTDLLSVGKGYAVAYNPGDDLKEFIGELNTGSLQFAATFTPPWNQKGFNLVGNPYPSAIDADTFIGDNPILEGGLYFWDETLNYDGERWDYATYTLVGGTQAGGAGNAPDGIIAPMQGFMILADQSGDINFNNNMRVTDDAFFFKAQEEKSRIWLSVIGPEGDYNEILAGFHADGEMGVDKSDAVKLKGNEKLAFYMILEEKNYIIQGMPTFDPSESYTLPLGIDAGFAGEYVFSARKIEQFEPEVEIILEDRITGEMLDLRGTETYTALIPNEGTISDRFFLHINGSTSVPVIGNQKLTKVYAVDNQIIISHTENSNILDVEVINTLGQLVVQTPVNATETTITVPGRNLVYIVKIRTDEGVESHKLLIR
jgi:hypothetical protein